MSILDELLQAERATEELPAEDVQRLRVSLQAAVSAGAHLAATGAASAGASGAPDAAQSAADAASAASPRRSRTSRPG